MSGLWAAAFRQGPHPDTALVPAAQCIHTTHGGHTHAAASFGTAVPAPDMRGGGGSKHPTPLGLGAPILLSAGHVYAPPCVHPRAAPAPPAVTASQDHQGAAHHRRQRPELRPQGPPLPGSSSTTGSPRDHKQHSRDARTPPHNSSTWLKDPNTQGTHAMTCPQDTRDMLTSTHMPIVYRILLPKPRHGPALLSTKTVLAPTSTMTTQHQYHCVLR